MRRTGYLKRTVLLQQIIAVGLLFPFAGFKRNYKTVKQQFAMIFVLSSL